METGAERAQERRQEQEVRDHLKNNHMNAFHSLKPNQRASHL